MNFDAGAMHRTALRSRVEYEALATFIEADPKSIMHDTYREYLCWLMAMRRRWLAEKRHAMEFVE